MKIINKMKWFGWGFMIMILLNLPVYASMETYWKIEYRGYSAKYKAQMENITILDLIVYKTLSMEKRNKLLMTVLKATVELIKPKGDILAQVWDSKEDKPLLLKKGKRFLLYNRKTKQIEYR